MYEFFLNFSCVCVCVCVCVQLSLKLQMLLFYPMIMVKFLYFHL